MSEIIAEKLINIGSVQFSFDNHFTLTSGLKSPVYVDCRRIISFVEERDFIMGEAINYFQKNNLQFDLIAGGETAGIPYAAIISEKTKKPMLYIRKKPKGFGKNQQIEGEFNKNHSLLDTMLAGFPAGTVTGAPKIRAMEIIDELEKSKRKMYAGAIGYFSPNKNFDTCIALRTALIKKNKFYIQSGAGIVADSVPEKEYLETVNKAKALISSLN